MPLMMNAGYPANLFSDKTRYLSVIRAGISGALVKETVKTLPHQRDVICKALRTTSGNLSRLYQRKQLSTQQSEEVLDVLDVYSRAFELYEDMELAQELLETRIPALNNQKPNDLLDTFVGRSMVKELLNKMKWGEFT